MILRHFADTLVFATNSETTCNEVRSVETPVKEPDEWNQTLSNEVLFFIPLRYPYENFSTANCGYGM